MKRSLNLSVDWFFERLVKAATVVAGLIILVIVLFVAKEAWPGLSDVGLVRLGADEKWSPTSGQYNVLPMVVGTLAVCLGSFLLAFPIGIGCGVFLNFYAPRLVGGLFRRILEILGGIPSVVFGLWGLAVVVPWIAEHSPISQGQSLLAGIIILAMMTLPTIALSADAALAEVSSSSIRGAAALGLGKRAIIWSVVIPQAMSGILTGGVLQLARALGETMAVLMVCGNVVQIPHSVFEPVRTLTANIALEMGYADSSHRSMLFVSGLLLLIIVTLLILAAQRVRSNSRIEAGGN